MARTVTQKYEEMVLEVDFEGNDTFSRICGIKGVSISRTANVEDTEITDCDDEAKPNEILSDVRSIKVSASGEGTWAQQSHGKMMDWLYSGQPLNVRLGNLKAIVGDTEYETGPAVLSQLNNSRPEGKGRVTASIEISFSGTPERTAKA